ncbi:MAG: 30S ribosomal protein S6 [Owenweeksia sp.]|nr:30S ribosomal protein S6 [Owenweeksia sp.]MBF98033.1 30S ribosomal protein S6 [Owenweeksia sp.]HBF18453.1 30S ribosomal protein S6 [Cryomorphaceae bacterium]|tara:strand:+ start:876 stop:1211 length:336 start_codon:yes stop_codon:yes gene_type:complete
MNQYETVFIMNPVLSDEQVRETVDKFKNLLESNEGKVLNEENWGLRKLAYPIQHKRSGFYHLLEFQAPGGAIEAMEVEMKRDERIMRFLTVRMDKHHVEFAAKRRKKMQNA